MASGLYESGAALGELPTATRSKYKFLGWYTAATGGTKVSASTKVTADAVYYAHWQYDGLSRVDGKVVDGCADMGAVSGGKSAKGGTKVTLKATAKKGFVFSGWYCDAAGDEPVRAAEDHRSTSYSYVAGEDDATFYAKFIPVAADWATVGCEVADEYATKQAIEPITVAADGGSLPTVKVAGLPAGLKFTTKVVLDKNKSVLAEANTIYGTPTKSGVFNAKVTVTTAGKATASTDLVFTVLDRVNDERVLRVECNQSAGKATGAGVYAAGKKVTLKATAAKNHVFAGWYADSDCTTQLVGSVDCRTASFPYAMPDADATVWAKFVPATEDADVKLFIGGSEVTSDAAGTVFNTAGELTLALDVESASAPKIAVSGLPAGLKFTAKEVLNKDKSVLAAANTIYGTATKPGTYVVTAKLTNTTVKKAVEKKFTVVVDNLTGANDCFREPIANARGEKYGLSVGVADLSALPSLVLKNPNAKLSVSGLPSGLKYNAKTGAIEGVATKAGTFTVQVKVDKAVSTFTLEVEPLPEWAVGTFEGAAHARGVESGWEDAMTLSVTVGATGKVSFKMVDSENGRAETLAFAGTICAACEDGVTLDFDVCDKKSNDRFAGTATIAPQAYDATSVVGVLTADCSGTCGEDGAPFENELHAVQNVWKSKTMALPAIADGTVESLCHNGNFTIDFKFKKDGSATAALHGGSGAKALDTCSCDLMLISRTPGDGWVGSLAVLFPKYDWVETFAVAVSEAGAISFPDYDTCVQLWKNGPYWAECNVGATKPEECGYYFWWGDTVGYKRNANDDGWVSVKDGSSFLFSGNCPTYGMSNDQLKSAGYIDATGNLVAAHDAATAHLGAPWRMPTDSEVQALDDNCTTTWTSRNGVSGRLVKGRGAYSSKSIFLPAAGDGSDSGLYGLGSHGNYWSSTPYSGSSYPAWDLFFGSGYFFRGSTDRYYGQSVRPVRGFAK